MLKSFLMKFCILLFSFSIFSCTSIKETADSYTTKIEGRGTVVAEELIEDIRESSEGSESVSEPENSNAQSTEESEVNEVSE